MLYNLEKSYVIRFVLAILFFIIFKYKNFLAYSHLLKTRADFLAVDFLLLLFYKSNKIINFLFFSMLNEN